MAEHGPSEGLSASQRRVLSALFRDGATGELHPGHNGVGDPIRNQTTVSHMVAEGLLPHNRCGRTLRSLEERGLIGGREVLLNQEWGNWCVWWLTPEGRALVSGSSSPDREGAEA